MFNDSEVTNLVTCPICIGRCRFAGDECIVCKGTGAVQNNSKSGLTAYRKRCIRVAEYLSKHPPTKGVEIKKALGEEQASNFLSNDYYGWFEKVDRGIYQLSTKGKEKLPELLKVAYLN